MVRQRVRMRFGKQGDLRLIGHRDLMRCLERLFRRAALPLAMSQGFHPKPRMTFPSALAVGIEGVDEVLELELSEPCAAERLLHRLRPDAPKGLTLRSVEVLSPGAKKARVRSLSYEVPIPASCGDGLAEKVHRLLAASCYPLRRPGRQSTVDLRPLLEELSLREGVLRMRLRADAGPGAGPRDVLSALDLPDLERNGVHLKRTAVEIR
jgi:radical SAM-linked protein